MMRPARSNRLIGIGILLEFVGIAYGLVVSCWIGIHGDRPEVG